MRNPDTPILFLDFDGVLHPDDVYIDAAGEVYLSGDQKELGLFCWLPIFEEILASYPSVQIVLSTSWVRQKGLEYTLARLPQSIKERVIGATAASMSGYWFDRLTRYEQIVMYTQNQLMDDNAWVAIDNDSWGWKSYMAENLVLTDDDTGISAIEAQEELIRRLDKITK